ncbi:hypothetical protein TIFTF001_027437 [Ficus carica]|uniref:Uncharacterized protein n=1 Tax=Ficus carica TaxID=3494 RepID=A0AA88DN22_FICCA|nr:hypothetical protein TIFTF001_027437 [Ficus carica]
MVHFMSLNISFGHASSSNPGFSSTGRRKEKESSIRNEKILAEMEMNAQREWTCSSGETHCVKAKSRSGTAINATLQLKVKETRFSTSKGKKHKAAYEALNVNNMTSLLNIVPSLILKKSSQPGNDSGKSDALK